MAWVRACAVAGHQCAALYGQAYDPALSVSNFRAHSWVVTTVCISHAMHC